MNEPDAKRGKLTRAQLVTLFETKGFAEAARLSMSTVALNPGIQVLAFKLQEAGMMHGDVSSKLSSAISVAHEGTGGYGYYVNHNGDGESGDVVYSSSGKLKKAPYEIGSMGGKSMTNVDTANAVDVSPTIGYEELADEDDHYTAMQEAKLYTEGPCPLIERFISKGERDKADEGSFAGKGKSFPILKPSDVGAAVHAMGRAGSANYGMSKLKANIIRIAKEKGWTSELPKAWRGGDSTDATEAAVVPRGTSGTLKLVESLNWAESEAIELFESAGKAVKEIKIIAPGEGSSAFYPAEVLKRDGPTVFGKGTQIYINHATKAEEAERPEGDWHKLVGALEGPAYWKESDKHGPGLYGMAGFAADMAPQIFTKAPWSGMSIRANGNAQVEAGRPVMKNGKPVLAEFTGCESIDIVTRAGAGGMILTE
ncbi:MAG TPA: hypothetical protein VNH83_20190, partial [Bryobacteraceae bacterium]|nr:hypothetical protein [Bryobacteraceae bacterium]